MVQHLASVVSCLVPSDTRLLRDTLMSDDAFVLPLLLLLAPAACQPCPALAVCADAPWCANAGFVAALQMTAVILWTCAAHVGILRMV